MDDIEHSEETVSFDVQPQRAVRSAASKHLSVLTYHGSLDAVASLQEPLSRDLAADPYYWKRSTFKSNVKEIFCNVEFLSFSDWETTFKPDPTTIILGPILHLFVTDCQTLDLYKNHHQALIAKWVSFLESNQQDWMIIVLVRPEVRKAARSKVIPKLDIFEKVKTEFCSKTKDKDRCQYIFDPKSGLNDQESWRHCIVKLRQLIYEAYDTRLRLFEEKVRIAKENRPLADWKFFYYFHLRETFSRAYQRLDLLDEALFHLDELDSSMSLYVGDISNSLDMNPGFRRVPSEWLGLQAAKTLVEDPQRVLRGEASLLEIRTFLFLRQTELLKDLRRETELAARLIPFIQCVNQDQKLAKPSLSPGALECWTFLVCHEAWEPALTGGDGNVQQSQLLSATLQGIALEKLMEVGKCCGLLPEHKLTQEHWYLLSVLEDTIKAPGASAATLKLYDALRSSETFTKSYLEMAEMTMGTFKHIGRTRAARLIGIEVAKYYMKLKRFEKAASFLLDAIKHFRDETWNVAGADAAIQYSACVKSMEVWDQVLKSALLIVSSDSLSMEERFTQQQQLLTVIREKLIAVPTVIGCSRTIFIVECIPKDPTSVLVDREFDFEVTIRNLCLEALPVESITVCLLGDRDGKRKATRMASFSSNYNLDSYPSSHSPTDRYISCSTTAPTGTGSGDSKEAPSLLFTQAKRARSGMKSPEQVDWKDIPDGAVLVSANATQIDAGVSSLHFRTKLDQPGTYHIAQLRLNCYDKLTLVTPAEKRVNLALEVHSAEPDVIIKPVDSKEILWSNECHDFVLSIFGDVGLDAKDPIPFSFQSTNSEVIQLYKPDSTPMPEMMTASHFELKDLKFKVRGQCDERRRDQKICVKFSWMGKPKVFPVTLVSPVTVSFKWFAFPPSSLLTGTLRNDYKSTLAIRKVRLVGPGSWTEPPALQSVFDEPVLKPTEVFRLLWKMDRPPSSTEAAFLEIEMFDVHDNKEHTIFKRIREGPFGSMVLQVSTEIVPEMLLATPTMITYVVAHKNVPQDAVIYYQIRFDAGIWSIDGNSSGVLDLEKNDPFLIKLTITPNKEGIQPLPSMRFFTLQNEDIIPVDAAHLYNTTLFRTVLVNRNQVLQDNGDAAEI